MTFEGNKRLLLLKVGYFLDSNITYYFFTGLVMIGVIIGSKKVGINPDNVATPIAASLGDLITLSLLAGVSSTLYDYRGEHIYLN